MILLGLCAFTAPAMAQDPYYEGPYAGGPYAEEPSSRGFVEVFGNWGVNLGRTMYVPDEVPGESKHPFAKGFGGGAAIGITVAPRWLEFLLDYRYGRAETREGSVIGALSEVQGSVDFHMITAGLRMRQRAGNGFVYGQLAFGVVAPFETKIEQQYAPELSAIGIEGEGSMVDEYKLGYGGHAEMGYKLDIGRGMYLGAGVRIAAFQATNAGKETELTNFVTDFTAPRPFPVTTNIHHGSNGPNTPTTYSIQDVRVNISLGYRF